MTKHLLPHQKVRLFVQNQIASGHWKPGILIPSEMKLAEQLSVHRLTVNRVLTEFAREGLFVRRRVYGTMLLDRRKPSPKPQGDHRLVGLITGHHFDPVTNPFFGAIFERLRKILKGNGIYLIPLGDASDYLNDNASSMSSAKDLAAIAMLGIPESDHAIAQLEECGCPAVIIGMSEYHGPLPHVATEDEEDAGVVARKLLALGHRHIVHLNAIPPKRIQSRLHGFLHACEDEGQAIPFRYIVEAQGLEMRDGKEAMQDFIKRGLPFTAVFGAIDNLAIGAMSALAESGLSIPGQVSVVGFDGIDAALHSTPPLSTMSVSRSNLAEMAADCLIALCDGRPVPPQNQRPHSKWIEGGTLGLPPASEMPVVSPQFHLKEKYSAGAC